MTPNWLDLEEYPFKSNYYDIASHRLHYIEEGEGETLLFIHGTPSWSFDYRNVIKGLKSHFRCIAIDHIGFGLSDKPRDYLYTTQNHSNVLEQFVVEKELTDLTLIVHDFGGPIGLDFATRNVWRIKRLIILNSWLWSNVGDADYNKIVPVLKNPITKYLYLFFNFSPKFVLPNSFGKKKLSKSLLKQYTRPFTKKSERLGVWGFAQSLLDDQDWFEQIWVNSQVLIDKPTLLFWGMKDPVIRPQNLEKFSGLFKNSITIKLETCGHFPQEEDPELMVKSIADFINVTKH